MQPQIDLTKINLIHSVTQHLLLSLIALIIVSVVLTFVFWISKKSVSMIFVVTVFGVCGGFISIQRRLKDLTLEDLQLLSTSWPYAFLSPLIGGILALILYMLFISGLLAGELFPAFEAGDTKTKDFSRLIDCVAKNHTDYAKLVFWSFVAGYSETFVTNIIGTFASTAQKAAQ